MTRRRALGAPAAAAAAALGGAALLAGAFLAPERTAFAWLAAWAFAWTTMLGALTLVLVHHLVGASWYVAVRRAAEMIFAPLPLLALLFLPVLLALELLFPWARPETLAAPHVIEAVRHARAYLDPGFFALRALLFFAVWIPLGAVLARWSRAPAAPAAADGAARQRRLSAAAVVPFGLALQFASVDWLMSLEPAWVSSMFAVYVLAGALVAGLALQILVVRALARAGRLPEVTVSHYHAMGKLLLTFVSFWAYVAYFQFLLIWIANVPEEVAWYVPRASGAWRPWAIALVLGHFAVPFLLLLSRTLKRRPDALAGVAAWLLAFHALDLYWVVMPAHAPGDATPHALDAAAFAALGAGLLLYGVRRARGEAALPRGDPRLAASLRFETG